MLNHTDVLTPANDPLKGVSQVWRNRALDAVIKTLETAAQSEAFVRLRTVAYDLADEYQNELVTEPKLTLMNHRIHQHVSEWVHDKNINGGTHLQVEPFLFEVKIKHEDGHSFYYFEYPEVYEQLERGTAPYDLASQDRYALHAMAREWLNNHPPFINKSIPDDSVFFELPELNDLFGQNKGLKPGEFWAVGALSRFTSEMVLSDLLSQLSKHAIAILRFDPQIGADLLAMCATTSTTDMRSPRVVFLTGLEKVSRKDIQELRRVFSELNIAVLAHIPLSNEAVHLETSNAVMWPEEVLGRGYWGPYRRLSDDVDGELLVCPDWFGTNVFRGKHRGNPESGKLAAARIARDNRGKMKLF